jgi:hypothetical protein
VSAFCGKTPFCPEYGVGALSEMLALLYHTTRNMDYVFSVILMIHSDYFPKQDYVAGLYYGETDTQTQSLDLI